MEDKIIKKKNNWVIKKVKVKGYWRYDTLIPKRVKSHTREIWIPKNRIVQRKKIMDNVEGERKMNKHILDRAAEKIGYKNIFDVLTNLKKLEPREVEN